MIEFLPIIHLVATAAMTGLIWFVQIVHYPLFARVGYDRFVDYEMAHQTRTTCIVMPLMLGELLAAVALILTEHPRTGLAWSGLSMLVLIWLSTFLVQVPLHARLARSFDAFIARRLVSTNWVRTALWTARTLVAVVILESPAGA